MIDRLRVISINHPEPRLIYVGYKMEIAGENHEINIANKRFENVAQFKYLETTVANKNLDSGGN
jgi:hypothetical protein